LQRGAQAHPFGHAVLVVGRDAQVAERSDGLARMPARNTVAPSMVTGCM
jgi:hypothetical protein